MTQPHPEAPLRLRPGPHRLVATPDERQGWTEVTLTDGTATGHTLAALIVQAIRAKQNALFWQAYIAKGQFKPWSETYARQSVAFHQKHLVQLLTQIIAGDEATLAAHGGQP